MESSPFSRCGLYVVAVLLLVVAFSVWTLRTQHPSVAISQLALTANPGAELTAQEQRDQHAVALLFRAFQADNRLTYSALTKTSASYGRKTIEATARITRAPDSLKIAYISGNPKGLSSGFSKRWFWRQYRSGGPQAFAEMQDDTVDLAAKRFALMLDNYAVVFGSEDKVGGRPVEIVELRPFHPLPGATGPMKRLAIDTQTGLTLRVETFDCHSRQIMSTTMTELDLNPPLKSVSFEPAQKILESAQKKPWLAQDMGRDVDAVTRLTGIVPPKPAYIPAGFRFDSVGVHRCVHGGHPFQAALTRYTDGLNTLTVFAVKPQTGGEEFLCDEASKGKASAKGGAATGHEEKEGHACDFGSGSLVGRDTKQGHVIVVADLPSETLQHVADTTSVLLAGASNSNPWQ